MVISMKLAFSTLGCPDWSWKETISVAKDLGYKGIEIRGIEKQMYLPQATLLSGEKQAETLKRLQEIGLSITCLASSVYLHDNDVEGSLKSCGEYIELAAALKVPYIRVLGDTNPAPGTAGFPRERVVSSLRILGKKAAAAGVMLLLETNGHLADSQLMAGVMEELGDNSGVGVLWDMHHPYRYFNESPEKTVSLLGKYIRYTHIKDSKQGEDGKLHYLMLGEGDIPVEEAILALKNIGYDGWFTLEWVKQWNPDIESPSIVFPNYLATMQRYLSE